MTGRAYLAGLALAAAVLALAGALTIPPLAARGDFAEQWAAARFTLDGGDPYDPAVWRDAAARLAGRASDARAFVYPPYVTLALVPFALVPLPVAATAFVAVSAALAAVAVGRLLQASGIAHPVSAFAFGFTLLASGPAILAIAQGQWDLLLVAAVASGASARLAGRAPFAALALVLKPQLAPLSILGFVRETAGPARRRLLVALGAVLAAIALTAVAVFPLWQAWLRGAGSFAASPPVRTTTLATTLEALAGPTGALVAALLAVTAIGVCLAAPRGDATLALWLATAVLVAPYIQAYDQLLLLPPLVLASAAAARRPGPLHLVVALAGCGLLTVGGLAASAVTMSRGADLFGALVPLAIWLLVAAVVWRVRAAAV
ncbi:MAG TPA: glycosyltransferase 87 family protein [Candidatus Limnocylindria bacterium]|nr:glycosyltransferase 87 family protein [Candidatus Limnocylindria bacterium]